MNNNCVIVRGGGDLASGVIHRLHRCGYRVLILECEKPSAIRRKVAFCEAVYDKTAEVEGVLCRQANALEECAKDKQQMFKKIDKVKGVKWTISMSSLIGPSVPDSMIPKDVRKMMQSKDYELAFVSTKYESATDPVNTQIKKIDKIVKSYDKSGMVIGEAPLMKDLQDVTDVDLVNVNIISIAAIFVIILIIFKSISLPVILVAVIEFAIMINMAIPYYQGISLPFVASIVIGAIQLGATVDYAILMTTRYQKERSLGKDKMEAISIAHKTSMPSIISSGLSFFAATFGVACYSQVEMIGSICTLLARGAIISMIVVLLVLPAMFMIFDKLICKTSIGFLGKKAKAQTNEAK